MKLWKFNKRSSTLADMSMNRVLLTELIAKGAVVGVVAGFCGATYRYLILESEHLRWQLMEGITLEWALGWLIAMVVFAFIVDRLLTWAPLSGGSGIPLIQSVRHQSSLTQASDKASYQRGLASPLRFEEYQNRRTTAPKSVIDLR